MAESAVENGLAPSGSQPRPQRRSRIGAKRKATLEAAQDEELKKKKTFNNFYTFCSFVLEYEEKLASERSKLPLTLGLPPPRSPTNSAGESSPTSSTPSSSDSSSGGSEASDRVESPSSSSNDSGEKLEYTSDDESWNLVTCFCRRPFAGRPMIECSKCSTWVHLFCAKIRKDHVPEVYVCPSCTKASS